MIELRDVKKTYKMGDNIVSALKGVNLTIGAGELVAMVGPSGCGKSSIMNILGMLDRPTSGVYSLNGKEVSTLEDDEQARFRNQHVGFIFQSFFLLPRLTALQNIGLPLLYRGAPRHEMLERSQKMLEKINIQHLAKHKPNELSGGQQQRVAIARALVGNPSILLADEPTGALDSKTGQEVMDLFIELNTVDKTTIIIVTHDPGVAKQCQRIIRMQDGLIVAEERK